MNPKAFKITGAFLLAAVLSACGGSYYKVADPSTEKIYYTDEIEKVKSGAIKLLDANTGNMVTLQNSEVTEISKEEFKANTPKSK